MEIFVAELYDYSWGIPMLVGIYDDWDKVNEAITIVLKRYKEKDPKCPDARFVRTVTPVQLNGFCPAVIDNLGCEG